MTTVCGTPATTLTCNDDGTGCPNFNSLTPSVDMTAGTTYYIAMGSYDSATTGSGTLRVIQTLSNPTSAPSLSPTWAPQTVGPTAAALTGYNLVETQPDCYFKIGYPYCPAPGAGQQFSDLYASYQDRLGTTLLNAARLVCYEKCGGTRTAQVFHIDLDQVLVLTMRTPSTCTYRVDPAGFKTAYMGTDDFACTVSATTPVRYAPGLYQAAKQQVQALELNCLYVMSCSNMLGVLTDHSQFPATLSVLPPDPAKLLLQP